MDGGGGVYTPPQTTPPYEHTHSSRVNTGFSPSHIHVPCTLTLRTPHTHPHTSLQAKVNVTQGRYPMTTEELHTLAGYQAAIELGSYDTETAKPHNIKLHLSSFYPKHMLGNSAKKLFKSPTEKLESKLVESYQAASQKSTDSFNLKVLYLQLCWSKPFYG